MSFATSKSAHPLQDATTPLRFRIREWAACAPGLLTQHEWLAWSANPQPPLPSGNDIPPVTAMAPMLRRRLAHLGRAALHCVYGIGQAGTQNPLVFASRHGETTRLRPMLADLAAGEPLSPTAFGLAVHNAIGALHSIDRGDTSVMQAVAAGRDTIETAIVEAVGLLADGYEEVAVVACDAPLDPAYSDFVDEPECLYAWAWSIGHAAAGAPAFSLTQVNADDGEACAALLPHGLEVLRFMLGQGHTLEYRGQRSTWIWQRHD